jgi:subtilisin family serine protease
VNPLELVRLPQLMQLSSGRADVVIGLLDGPVASSHPDLAQASIRAISGTGITGCTVATSSACRHGTFVAGILSARRGSAAPSICPDCTLLVWPVFAESAGGGLALPTATPHELATAIREGLDAGARVLNLSLVLANARPSDERALTTMLDHAAQRGVLVVAAAGNQASIGSSAITRHPWVISVVGYDASEMASGYSNFAFSIARRGLGAPGTGVTSIDPDGKPPIWSGTSVAAPFVTGAIALLWSLFPSATPAQVKWAVTHGTVGRRNSIIPPLLDAWAAYQLLRNLA